MGKILVGTIWGCGPEILTYYYSENKKAYVDVNDEPLSDETLNEWAILLASPWSQVDEEYKIMPNAKDAYTQIETKDQYWKCTYSVVSFDMMEASLIGYGNSEMEALSDCILTMQHLQKTYNKENKSI